MFVFLAIDLGAGSGRVIAAIYNTKNQNESSAGSLELKELHRFENYNIELPSGYFWDIAHLYRNICQGIQLGVEEFGDQIQSIGIDTWGCDYALLDQDGELLGMPFQYRDSRTQGMDALADAKAGQKNIYAKTGIMPAFYNTSQQLLAETQKQGERLANASQLLFIPDLLAYWLTGVAIQEQTVASTSQLFDPLNQDWAWEIIDQLEIPRHIFKTVTKPGQVIGTLRKELIERWGCKPIPVTAVPSHDTASAVAGIPLSLQNQNPDQLDVWISCGTWSIMGTELPEPILTESARMNGFANEVGINDTIRFLKNISGLWIIQECRRYWSELGESVDFGTLAELSERAPAFTAFIDPDDAVFSTPGNMPLKIQKYCEQTNQEVPQDKGHILRVAVESLALKYKYVFEQLRTLVNKPLGDLYIAGGGIQNKALMQSTANALGCTLYAGPIEATALGNAITQMITTKHLESLQAGRELIYKTQEAFVYHPQDKEIWNQQYQQFLNIIKR